MLTHHHQAIALDPSSPWGYEMKYAASHKAGDFDSAVDALETMLSKIVQSPDPEILRELYSRYNDELFILFDSVWLPVHQPIEHTSNDP